MRLHKTTIGNLFLGFAKKPFLVVLCLLASIDCFAQNGELFTVATTASITAMKTSATQKEVADRTMKDPYLKKMDIVQVADISKLQKNSEITFTLPRHGKVTAKAMRIEAISTNNFKWIGEINAGGTGYMIIYNQNGNISGHIWVDNKSFQIKALGNNVSILAEMDTKKMGGKFCNESGTAKTTSDTPTKTTPNTNRIDPCTQNDKIRVLVVYTQRALNAVGLQSIQDRVNVSLDQFNTAYSISSVSNPRAQLELVAIEQTNFVETTTGGKVGDKIAEKYDVDRLPDFTENRRVATNADIVVGLVDAGYTFSRGIAKEIGGPYSSGFVSCEVRAIPDQPVFPHEIGHLLGGRHPYDPYPQLNLGTDNTPGDAHGYSYNKRKK